MGMLAEWKATRDRRRRSAAYLESLLVAPDPAELAWLTALCGDGAVARRELVLARRAVGLIVAERDALDDRTASDVAHQLAAVVDREARDTPAMASAWAERWRAYTAALAVRGDVESPATRLARVLLVGAGGGEPSAEALARATGFIVTTRTRANEVLRDVFGVASLPEDVRPSAMRV